jgi:hypothetical protein
MINRVIICFIILISAKTVFAQEFNLEISVLTPKLNLVDPKVFNVFEGQIREFYNNTKWTDDEFQTEERIQGNLQITIKDELGPTAFVADIRINTIRPVFDSNYNTQLLNYIDKDVSFSYVENQQLADSRNTFVDNFSSILTFYAFVMLGYDYDSFAPEGGEKHFQIAQDIVNLIPSEIINGADRAWGPQGPRRSRYWLIENILNPKVRPLRQAMYTYHLQSLDKMTLDQEMSRVNMLTALTEVSKVERAYRNAMVVQMFTDSKRDEILEVFKEASRGHQNKVFKIMTQIDPARSSEYGIFK